MKRLLVLVLLVPILTLTMISCDFYGNIYEDAGYTAQAKAIEVAVAEIGTGANVADTASTTSTNLGMFFEFFTSLGFAAENIVAPEMLAPQNFIQAKELKDNLGDVFNFTPIRKKILLDNLKKPVTAGQQAVAQGTVEVINQTLENVKTIFLTFFPDIVELGVVLEKLKLPVIVDGAVLTQGDMLALQLMTDLINNTVAIIMDVFSSGGALDLLAIKDNFLSIFDDALFVAQIVEQISGATYLDFSGQIDLGSLLDGFGL